MILETIVGDILASQEQHIAFAMNAEGVVGTGGSLAAAIANRYWPDLTGEERPLGSIRLKCAEGRRWYALIINSAMGDDWTRSEDYLEIALDHIKLPDGERLAIPNIGHGRWEKTVPPNYEAMYRCLIESSLPIVLYQLPE